MTGPAPRKDVVKVRELTGPRGGRVLVMQLECGHLVWQRRSHPPLSLRCVSCWWDAESPCTDARDAVGRPDTAGPASFQPWPAWLHTDGWAGRRKQAVVVVGETPKCYRIEAVGLRIRLAGSQRYLNYGETALVPRSAISPRAGGDGRRPRSQEL